ncbi:MAG: putative zinc metalloprotease [Candidatus Parcubacteria bacterium]|nr:MAG: putative zinc metalloprotease [Candidatus Parcubacteria bacterium]
MTLIAFLFFIGLLILVHELGHFLGAKKVGLKVEEFSIGFPPKIFSKKIKDTVYSLGLILFGGYVKLKGENDPQDLEGFLNLKPIKKLIVVLAGIFFNIILAYFFFAFSLNLGYPVETNKIFVSGFLNKNTQGYKYFKIGDEIVAVKINDKIFKPESPLALSKFLKENQGKEVEIFYLRDGQELSAKVVPPVGFYIANFKLEKTSLPYSFILAFEKTFTSFKKIIFGFGQAIKSLITKEKIDLEIIGPVGIYNLFDNFKNFGLGYLFYFLAVLSLNLAFINLLPFPALDGGRAIFIIFEILTRKRINYQKEEIIHRLGFIFLLFLLLVVTFKDIYKLWFK